MAYGNYGAFVYCNGSRREDKEDVTLFDSCNIKSFADYCHGVLGDGDIRVKCYKQYNPEIYIKTSDETIEKISYCDEDSEDFDCFEFDVKFEYNGYKFYFKSGEPNYAKMTEPDGTVWECHYDYAYGAGWMD